MLEQPGRFVSQKSIFELHSEADQILLDIEKLIEADPIGAAKSWIGRKHLLQNGWLLGSVELAEKYAGCDLISRYGWKPDPERPGMYDEFGDQYMVYDKDAPRKLPDWNYPYKFGIEDVVGKHTQEMIFQLIAMEYVDGEVFENGDDTTPENPLSVREDLTPFTLDAVYASQAAEERRNGPPIDPFSSDYRPDVTIVQSDMSGKVIAEANLNTDAPVTKPPKEGFREVNRG